jgi:hypothetical protein
MLDQHARPSKTMRESMVDFENDNDNDNDNEYDNEYDNDGNAASGFPQRSNRPCWTC